jgi:hypothetical protein
MDLLAEQILIDCPPSRLETLFSHRPATWMTPLLRLAGDEGEAAGLALRGEGGTADRGQVARVREHHVRVRRDGRAGGTFRATFLWQASDYRVLFSELDAVIEVRPFDACSVLSIEGAFTGPAGLPVEGAATVASRRAAETATRSLLGHLRSAVEESAYAAR